MKFFFIDKPIVYDGSQLSSHWILKTTGLYGDAIAAFIGPCRVDLANMVDLEDVIAKKTIFSESMLHFIIEHFDVDLERMILRQRLLISLMQQELSTRTLLEPVIRKGDDLFIGDKKLTVSIATASKVSTLIHTGINIISRGTPVPTLGLEDLHLPPISFAAHIMESYIAEMEGIARARVKVRAVK